MRKYTISEVSSLIAVKSHVIRYWEEEIPFLSPRKNLAGRRVYTDREVQLLLRLKHLLYDQKYTIEGAKKRIWQELNSSDLNYKSKIAEIRSDLINIWFKVRGIANDE
ncbi:hypothetical protein ES708_16723 [subsurface metagenome]